MAQSFPEVAHLRTNREKYNEGWDRIFGSRKTHEHDGVSSETENSEQTQGVQLQENTEESNRKERTSILCDSMGSEQE